MNRKSAISAIDKAGILLVFPIGNRKEPASLWSHFFPRSEMRWEWDEDGDGRVSNLWHLRSELSTTRKVVYTKWYQGRATYFSRDIFAAMLRAMNPGDPGEGLSTDARKILEILNGESPLSTKELKRMADLRGRAHETAYQRALNELWSRLLIVAFGEVDDGAFPSLAVGATKVLFEELWREAFEQMSSADAERVIVKRIPEKNPFLKHYFRLLEKRRPLLPRAGKSAAPEMAARKNGAVPRPGKVIRFEDL